MFCLHFFPIWLSFFTCLRGEYVRTWYIPVLFLFRFVQVIFCFVLFLMFSLAFGTHFVACFGCSFYHFFPIASPHFVLGRCLYVEEMEPWVGFFPASIG